MISRRASMMLLLAVTAIVAVVALLLPRIPQPQEYHDFADQRTFLGLPHIGDVISNLAFTVFGLWGLVFLLRLKPEEISRHFLDRRERWPYLFVFAGSLLTGIGSWYYHLHPDNASLVWDRLPMTIAFMSLVAAVIAERISLRAGLWLLPILLLVGMDSVLQWFMSEVRDAGDLRFYAAVQLYSVLVLVIALFMPQRYTRGWDLAVVAGLYALAKVLEILDRQIFALGHIVSGHTLKHLAAAAGAYWILRMLQKRRPLPGPSSDSPGA
jgi:hypothetical protein